MSGVPVMPMGAILTQRLGARRQEIELPEELADELFGLSLNFDNNPEVVSLRKANKTSEKSQKTIARTGSDSPAL